MKRKLAIAIVATAAAALAYYFVMPKTAPINEENFAKIQVGLSLSDVEALLGGPERDESSGQLLAILDTEHKKAAACMMGSFRSIST